MEATSLELAVIRSHQDIENGVMDFIPLAIFGTIAIVCYLRIIPILKRDRNVACLDP